jgi:hypothetical protein
LVENLGELEVFLNDKELVEIGGKDRMVQDLEDVEGLKFASRR